MLFLLLGGLFGTDALVTLVAQDEGAVAAREPRLRGRLCRGRVVHAVRVDDAEHARPHLVDGAHVDEPHRLRVVGHGVPVGVAGAGVERALEVLAMPVRVDARRVEGRHVRLNVGLRLALPDWGLPPRRRGRRRRRRSSAGAAGNWTPAAGAPSISCRQLPRVVGGRGRRVVQALRQRAQGQAERDEHRRGVEPLP